MSTPEKTMHSWYEAKRNVDKIIDDTRLEEARLREEASAAEMALRRKADIAVAVACRAQGEHRYRTGPATSGYYECIVCGSEINRSTAHSHAEWKELTDEEMLVPAQVVLREVHTVTVSLMVHWDADYTTVVQEAESKLSMGEDVYREFSHTLSHDSTTVTINGEECTDG